MDCCPSRSRRSISRVQIRGMEGVSLKSTNPFYSRTCAVSEIQRVSSIFKSASSFRSFPVLRRHPLIMPAIRRRQLTLSETSIELDTPQPLKKVRVIRKAPAGDPASSQDLECENKDLKTLVAGAFAFIERKEFISQAPAPIKKAMLARPNGVGLET